MNRNSSKQKTEMLLLLILCMVLAAVLFLRFVIFPLMDDCKELEKSIGEQEFQLSLTMADISTNSIYEEENISLTADIKKLTEPLCGTMTSSQLDKMLNGYFKQNGLLPTSMECTENVYDTGITVFSFEYTAEGSYLSLLDFISAINGESYLAIDNIEMKAIASDDIDAVSSDKMKFTIKLSAYMLSGVQ